ncbi:MAG: STAS domain-containing protein [Planctomycetes bacterium]|nr:STAS domain-containing protein [Planctomycetota bacterium]
MQTHVSERDGLILVVAADGGLNAGTAQQLIDEIAEHVKTGATQIIVDCAKLEVLSSMGLGSLLQIHNKMKKLGAEVRLCGLRSLLAQAILLSRLDKVFSVYTDVNAAKLSFRPVS